MEYGGSEIATIALRRANADSKENILDFLPKNITLLPNTSGASNAEEAIRIARLSRELGCGDFVKVEIIHETKYLLPDNEETIRATRQLAKEGFIVLPYMYPDLVAARKLEDAGAAAIMPLEPGTGMTYGCIALVFLMYIYNNFLSDMVNNELVKYIVLCAGMMAFMVLVYFGYIYLAVYLKLRFGKNMTLFLMLGLILFFPLSLFILMIVGFLYGSGPLKKYIIINKK